MAGMKGRSGGARPNTGGARPGAGRKPKPPVEPAVVADDTDPLTFLEWVMRGRIEASPLQVRAAVAAAQYRHTKTGDGGKRDAEKGAAKKAGSGKFAPKAPPKLVVNNR